VRTIGTIMQSIEKLPLTEALVDHVFDARYRCEAVLEPTVVGSSYRARDLALDELVCLELLPRSLAASNHGWSGVRSGLRKLAVQHHARIVEIYGLGVFSEGMPFVISEHLPGPSLRRVLSRGPLSLERALRLGRQLCEAVAAAHRASVVHGALEPAHVTVLDPGGERERLKLRGFGLGSCLELRRFDAHGGAAALQHYLSPEHIQGLPLDARSDVYSLGVMLYELVTGTPPFRGRDAGELLCQHLDDEPEPASTRLGSSSLELRVLDKILLRCLAKLPEQRYPSVADLEHDLGRLHAALGTRARRTPRVVTSRPTLCVHSPAPASHVALKRPLPKVIIRDAAS
jgi:serine/threonine-protein kinase